MANYLTFAAAEPFIIGVYNNTKNWDGTLEYSTDTATWNEWDGTTAIASAEHGSEQRIYMRGVGNSVITGGDPTWNGIDNLNRWVSYGSFIKCIGNIENLLDYAMVANGEHPPMAEHCFNSMFYGCTNLTQAPELPATTLSESCYWSMFDHCKNLTKAPVLPATTLAVKCYNSMFSDCTSLAQAPVLPATTLADYCYLCMFNGCTSLTEAPELPATTLVKGCYYSMFWECTSLTKVALPATTLAENCYYNMFSDCTSLTEAPELPATTLAKLCYYKMFEGCTSLTQAPELPATTLAQECYYYMFSSCTSLTKAPVLPATTLAPYCYGEMFYGCTSLKISETQTDEYNTEYRIPSSGTGTTATDALNAMFKYTGGTFTGTPEINRTYYLAASDPVPVTQLNPAALMQSFFVGEAVRRMRGKREPVAYLYGHVAKEGETPTHTINGVDYVGAVTPDIDTVWTDKKTYPYCIVASNENGIAVNFRTAPIYIVGVEARTNEDCTFVHYDLVDGVWSFGYEYSVSANSMFSKNISSWCWTSHVLCYEDGSIALAASDPVPVYE